MKTYFLNGNGNGYFRGFIVRAKDLMDAKRAAKAYTKKDFPDICFKEIDIKQEIQEIFDWDDLSYEG